VLRADELASSGFIVEQIRTAIQQSRLCIADLTHMNPNVFYEVGYTQAAGKPLVLLARKGATQPFDVAHQRIVFYGDDLPESKIALQAAISGVLSDVRLKGADELFGRKEYRAAIAAVAIVLEQRLRDVLSKRPPKNLQQLTLIGLVSTAQRRKILSRPLATSLFRIVALRNLAVHGMQEPTAEDAKFAIRVTREALMRMPEK
jgi:hypothetical protein